MFYFLLLYLQILQIWSKLCKVEECYFVDKLLFIGQLVPKAVEVYSEKWYPLFELGPWIHFWQISDLMCVNLDPGNSVFPWHQNYKSPPHPRQKHSKDFLRHQFEERNYSFLFHQCHLNVQDNTSHSSYNSIRDYQRCIGEVWTKGKLYVSWLRILVLFPKVFKGNNNYNNYCNSHNNNIIIITIIIFFNNSLQINLLLDIISPNLWWLCSGCKSRRLYIDRGSFKWRR